MPLGRRMDYMGTDSEKLIAVVPPLKVTYEASFPNQPVLVYLQCMLSIKHWYVTV